MKTIEKTAKLFTTGDYKDKGIKVTEADLDKLITSFKECPVKIEHSSSPFDGALGTLQRIWRVGTDLMGSISFTAAAWALIEHAGAMAKQLSISIKKDLSALIEVSLVTNPRIPGAAVFNAGVVTFSQPCNFNAVDFRAEFDAARDELNARGRQHSKDNTTFAEPDFRAQLKKASELLNNKDNTSFAENDLGAELEAFKTANPTDYKKYIEPELESAKKSPLHALGRKATPKELETEYLRLRESIDANPGYSEAEMLISRIRKRNLSDFMKATGFMNAYRRDSKGNIIGLQ